MVPDAFYIFFVILMANLDADVVTWAVPEIATGSATVTQNVLVSDSDFVYYSIRNGAPSDVKPYLQKSTVPMHLQWVSVPGVSPRTALKHLDVFIKVHLWHLERNAPAAMGPAARRKAGIILGISRCVMLSNYDLKASDFISGEVVAGPIAVTPGAGDESVYTILAAVANPPEVATPSADVGTSGAAAGATPTRATTVTQEVATRAYALLTDNLVLTADEAEALKAIVRSAQAILPIQGHNLLTDGHHYLSVADKPSFKAFLAVENQMWIGDRVKAYLEADKESVRDWIWHKAGHPVSPEVKRRLATSQAVSDSLANAGIGSASTRLPAVESELKPIQTYLKVSEAVRPSIEMYDGKVDNRALRDVSLALSVFPMGETEVLGADGQAITVTLGPYGEDPRTTVVRNRVELKHYAEALIKRSEENVAMCFGYFERMVEDQRMSSGMAAASTLSKAYSLKKLREACPSSYSMGYEFAADYKSFRAKLRADAQYAPPAITFS